MKSDRVRSPERRISATKKLAGLWIENLDKESMVF